MIRAILVFLYIIICISLHDNILGQINIPLSDHLYLKKECMLSKYASNIKNIPLETKDDCLLSDELQICFTGKYIFVSDMKTASFFRFDVSGKFLNKIGNKGQGPGEYINALFFRVDIYSEIVYIIDSYSKRLYSYGFNGQFIKSIPVQVPTYMIVISEGKFIYYDINYNQSRYELYLSDDKGKLLKRTTSKSNLKNKQKRILLEQPILYSYNNKFYYKNPLTDTVFQINNQLHKIPTYVINCGKRVNLNENQYDLNRNKTNFPILYIIGIDESSNNLFISYTYNENKGLAIYSKISNQITIPFVKGEYGLIDDLSGGPIYTLSHTIAPGKPTSIDNTLISILYYDEINEIYKKNNSEFSRSIKGLNEDCNPIIRIVTLSR
jgi:hypothetical protein